VQRHPSRPVFTVVTLAVCVQISACAPGVSSIPQHLPTASPTSTPHIVETPRVWNTFAYPGTALFSVDIPFGWIISPPFANSVGFSTPAGGEGTTASQPDIAFGISVEPTATHASQSCPIHPDATIAGLPATKSPYQEGAHRQGFAWRAANQATGIIVQFSVAAEAGDPSDYVAIYTHVLKSFSLAASYHNAPPCR
jgi:hypothetical protein